MPARTGIIGTSSGALASAEFGPEQEAYRMYAYDLTEM